MLDILIVFLSHSKSNAGNYMRYCGKSKLEITKRCFLSMIRTINHCKKLQPNVSYRMIVLDDRSDKEFLDLVKEHNIELIQSDVSGITPNTLKMYQIGKERVEDLVYFVMDDYLHYETALWEMIDAYFQLTELTKHEICIFPYDDPYRYGEKYMRYSQKIVLGARRHWRTAYTTACGFLMSKNTIVQNWDLFEKMGTIPYSNTSEDESINRLFINMKGLEPREITHLLFTPIPSLALHLGDETTRDPYLDWKDLWNQFNDNHSLTDLNLPEK